MKDITRACQALSDDTRLRIINVLMCRVCCVCEVMQALDISQTRASRNLKVLYDAGFLKLRKDGAWSLYSIDTETAGGYLSTLVEAGVKALGNNELSAQDKERLKEAKRVGPNCVR